MNRNFMNLYFSIIDLNHYSKWLHLESVLASCELCSTIAFMKQKERDALETTLSIKTSRDIKNASTLKWCLLETRFPSLEKFQVHFLRVQR